MNIAVEKIFTGVFIEENISENAVIPEHILSFEERAVAPLKGDCNDFVCALFKKVGNIEFCGVMAALGVSGEVAVYIYGYVIGDSQKRNNVSFPGFGNVNEFSVNRRRHILGEVGFKSFELIGAI